MTKKRIAFIAPRYAEGGAVGGAETLIKHLALLAVEAGHDVTLLTTCAKSHFTWENELKPGKIDVSGLTVRFFPVDERDIEQFLSVQDLISRERPVTDEQELIWLRNGVNSTPLYEHIAGDEGNYDKLVVGPYLFGLTYETAVRFPEKTVLLPCLHDESFAYLKAFKRMFENVSSIIFNTEEEMKLAEKLYDIENVEKSVVGIAMDAVTADPEAFRAAHGIKTPYIIYCGRREPLKGTPLLLDYVDAFRKRTGVDIKVVLTGSGQIEPPSSLREHIIDAGFVSEQDKFNAMAGAVVFCHPSVNESLGIVILESWLCGTPVMVNARGAVLPSQTKAANGGLWFRNYAEFEEELKLLMNNQEAAAALASSGKQFVETEYSKESVIPRLEKALS